MDGIRKKPCRSQPAGETGLRYEASDMTNAAQELTCSAGVCEIEP